MLCSLNVEQKYVLIETKRVRSIFVCFDQTTMYDDDINLFLVHFK